MAEMIKCPMCGKTHEVETITELTQTKIKGQIVEYYESMLYCCNCNEDEAYFTTSAIENENLLKARNQYRKMNGLLTSDDIVALRKQYDLSQADLSYLMGWGEVTVTRYESKTIQDPTYDNMLRLIQQNPLEMYRLLEKNKNSFSFTKFNQIKRKIQESLDSYGIDYITRQNIESIYLPYNEPSIQNGFTQLNIDKVEQVINYFAGKISSLGKVLLMKLLWYTDSLYFKENEIAITGLVYQHYQMGALPMGHNKILELKRLNVQENIEPDFIHSSYTIMYSDKIDMSTLSEAEKNVLDRVYNKFRGYNGKMIANYMHDEKAYTCTNDREIIPFSLAAQIRNF